MTGTDVVLWTPPAARAPRLSPTAKLKQSARVLVSEVSRAVDKIRYRDPAKAVKTGRVLVMIPAHDEQDSIGVTITALKRQTRTPDRIVVIADNCGDNTAGVARQYGATVMETVGNRDKKTGALNQGWEHHHKGFEYIAGVDADTVLEPDALQHLEKELREDRNVGGVMARYTFHQEGGMLVRMQRVEFSDWTDSLLHNKRNTYVLGGQLSLFRASALLKVAEKRMGVPWDTGTCQPAGTSVSVNLNPGVGRKGDWVGVAIEDVEPGHCVRTRRSDGFHVSAPVSAVGSRDYAGTLVTATAETGEISSYTDNHRVKVTLGDWSRDKFVTYIMRSNGRYRAGKSFGLRGYENKSHYGFLRRMLAEGAQALWVTGLFDTETEAFEHEQRLINVHHIPGTTFIMNEPHKRVWRSQNRLNDFWEELTADSAKHAREYLLSIGQSADLPFVFTERETDVQQDTQFNIRTGNRVCTLLASHLRDGMCMLPERIVQNAQPVRLDEWVPVTVSRSQFSGTVHSIEVPQHHTYFADGLLTHNCVEDMMLTGDLRGLGYKTTVNPEARAYPGAMHNLKSLWAQRQKWDQGIARLIMTSGLNKWTATLATQVAGLLFNGFMRLMFVVMLTASLSVHKFDWSWYWLIPPALAILLNIRQTMRMPNRTPLDVVSAATLVPVELYLIFRATSMTVATFKVLTGTGSDGWAAQKKAESGKSMGFGPKIVGFSLLLIGFVYGVVTAWQHLPGDWQDYTLLTGWRILAVLTALQCLMMVKRILRRHRGMKP